MVSFQRLLVSPSSLESESWSLYLLIVSLRFREVGIFVSHSQELFSHPVDME